jgi:hypothetical protein
VVDDVGIAYFDKNCLLKSNSENILITLPKLLDVLIFQKVFQNCFTHGVQNLKAGALEVLEN